MDGPPRGHRFRADIQGLRAFAVLVVVANHLLGWPVGGFVGVDVFFVISGFLITGHLMREWEKHGRISFTGFYQRRIKRILPASVLVLVVTVIGSFLVLGANRAWGVFWDGAWSFFFVANWRFASSGTDYFQADGPVSPLQHYWSLAVEEQFYFIWPWVMLGALVLYSGRRARRRESGQPRLVVGAVILALSAASFLWALEETEQAATVAYFSTFTRTWELGIGAVIALATPLLLRIPDRLRPSLAWVGILGMVVSIFVVSESSGFPAPAALLPVLSTGLVIVAGTGGEQRHIQPLTNRVAGYIGNISFSLYLWHMPVVILLGHLLPESGAAGLLLQVVVMFGLSTAAYHLWEDAIRRSPWLTGERGDWERFRLPRWYRPMAIVTVAGILAVLMITTAIVSVQRGQARAQHHAQMLAIEERADDELTEAQRELENATSVADLSPVALRAAQMSGPEATAITTEVEEALTLDGWGESQARMEDAIANNTLPTPQIGDCGSAGSTWDECLFGPEDASTTVVLTGDSVSLRWVAALLPLLEEYDWQLSVRGMFSCSFNDTYSGAFPDQKTLQNCIDRNEQTLVDIEERAPDLVLISNFALLPFVEGETRATPAQWEQGLQTYLERIQPISQAVVITGPAGEKDMRQCYTPAGGPEDCQGGAGEFYEPTAQASRNAAHATGAAFVDTRGLFCALDQCPPLVDGIPVKTDRTHITEDYAEYVGPALGEMIQTSLRMESGEVTTGR